MRLGGPLAACAAVAFTVLATGAPAEAQAPGPAPPIQPPSSPGLSFDVGVLVKSAQGAWADYAMTGPSASGGPKTITIRYALVEKSAQKMSLEIDTPTPKGDVLVRFDLAPAGSDAWKVSGGRIVHGAESAEMPKEEIAATPALKIGAQPGQLVGSESVTVPAGTFTCKHFRNKLTADDKGPMLDLWISDGVTPTGLVKSALSPIGITMQLAAVGTGAQAKVK